CTIDSTVTLWPLPAASSTFSANGANGKTSLDHKTHQDASLPQPENHPEIALGYQPAPAAPVQANKHRDTGPTLSADCSYAATPPLSADRAQGETATRFFFEKKRTLLGKSFKACEIYCLTRETTDLNFPLAPFSILETWVTTIFTSALSLERMALESFCAISCRFTDSLA